MGDIYNDAGEMGRQMQEDAQRQQEEMVSERQQQFRIPREFAEYLVELETRIHVLEGRPLG